MRYHFLVLFIPLVSQAALQCPVDKLTSYTLGNENKDNAIRIDADAAKMTQKTVHFSGNVIVKRGQESLYTDKADFNRQNKVLSTNKTMTYGRPDFALRAKVADYSLKSTIGRFKQAEYYLTRQKAIGQAQTLTINQQTQTEDLTNATYTTCGRLNPDWFLKAKKLHLDHKNDIGQAWGATFHIADIPVFYLPYLSFPLSDKRKTGFLFPKFGSSAERGLQLSTPFYLNISPNQDATLYPTIMSKRGFMLGSEYRYLLPNLKGIVSGTYLFKDRQVNAKRWSFKTQHNYTPTDKLTIKTLYQRVSDKNYIENLTNTLDLSNESFLPSYISADYRWTPNYQVSAQLKTYQVAKAIYTKANKPYDILPRLNGRGQWTWGKNLSFKSDSEIVNFDKENQVSGIRFDQKLSLSYLLQNTYSFIKPEAIYRYTHYNLHNQANGIPDRISRFIPTFSINSGLYFTRQSTWFGKGVTQTLKPQLFYLYTPYHDQSIIPDFDTAKIDSSYNAMFLNNRFNGKDRIGDANQITTAVSTTYVDNNSGRELAKLSVGQIQYFQDRRVSLNNAIIDSAHSSIIAEGRASLNDKLSIRGLIHRNMDTHQTEKSLLGFTYKKDTDKILNLSHLYDEDTYKQIDFSGVWRINDKWRTFWRWNYSLKYSRAIDTIVGIEYADCCWAVRLTARQKRNNLTSNERPENAVYLEFFLNGLGKVGNDTSSTLRNIIPNYRPLINED
ncbi:MAG: LPS-assembly protein LptD [Ostreibacterium sp.]